MEWSEAVFQAFNNGGKAASRRQLAESDIISLLTMLTEARTKPSRTWLGRLVLWIDSDWGGRGKRKCRTPDAVGSAAWRIYQAHKKRTKAELNVKRAAKSNKRRCPPSTT